MVGDGNGGTADADGYGNDITLRTEVVPLSRAFEMISHDGNEHKCEDSANKDAHDDVHSRRRVRIIHPYPYTFATFAKARWIGRAVVDIYHEEFGA